MCGAGERVYEFMPTVDERESIIISARIRVRVCVPIHARLCTGASGCAVSDAGVVMSKLRAVARASVRPEFNIRTGIAAASFGCRQSRDCLVAAREISENLDGLREIRF